MVPVAAHRGYRTGLRQYQSWSVTNFQNGAAVPSVPRPTQPLASRLVQRDGGQHLLAFAITRACMTSRMAWEEIEMQAHTAKEKSRKRGVALPASEIPPHGTGSAKHAFCTDLHQGPVGTIVSLCQPPWHASMTSICL
jgi:hypothetical protein